METALALQAIATQMAVMQGIDMPSCVQGASHRDSSSLCCEANKPAGVCSQVPPEGHSAPG